MSDSPVDRPAPPAPPPLPEVASRLRNSTLTARALAETALNNNRLGAYREVDAARTLAQADAADALFQSGEDRGPLQGLPISIKDLFGVPGYATCAGSPRRLPARFEQPGPVVNTLLAQHACITGKTHTVEFAFGGVGTTPHYTTPTNPWDAAHARAPGGSSAGAGVSLCEGSALLALGTDTAGSVRIPASWTGNVGLKTTRGRWSTAGVVPLSTTLDTVGLLARTAEDLAYGFAALDSATAPASMAPPSPDTLRLSRCDTLLFDHCDHGVVQAVEGALSELTSAGATLSAKVLPQVEASFALFLQGGPVAPEAGRFLTSELPEWLATMDPNVRSRIGDAAQLPEAEYQARLSALAELSASLDEQLRDVDALVAPTVANTPPRLAELDADTYPRENLLCLRNTSIANYLGLCAVTLPVGLDAAGMPVGLMLMARGGQDAGLVGLALAVERVLGTGVDRLEHPPGLPTG